VSEKYDNIMELLSYFNLNLPSNPITQTVFSRLSKVARRALVYNEEMDQKLLRKISLLNQT
jgi:hypothetical protein